jgi:hypothetical protein
MDDFENEVLASLAPVGITVRILRVKIKQAMIQYPEIADILDGALDELDDIEQRARDATAASAQYHRERWGQGK